jgi:hypothetical protein
MKGKSCYGRGRSSVVLICYSTIISTIPYEQSEGVHHLACPRPALLCSLPANLAASTSRTPLSSSLANLAAAARSPPHLPKNVVAPITARAGPHPRPLPGRLPPLLRPPRHSPPPTPFPPFPTSPCRRPRPFPSGSIHFLPLLLKSGTRASTPRHHRAPARSFYARPTTQHARGRAANFLLRGFLPSTRGFLPHQRRRNPSRPRPDHHGRKHAVHSESTPTRPPRGSTLLDASIHGAWASFYARL